MIFGPKKNWDKKVQKKKYFCQKKNYGSKKFWSKIFLVLKNFGSKKLLVHLGSKNICRKKIGSKGMGTKKLVDPKQCWVENNFWSKKSG